MDTGTTHTHTHTRTHTDTDTDTHTRTGTHTHTHTHTHTDGHTHTHTHTRAHTHTHTHTHGHTHLFSACNWTATLCFRIPLCSLINRHLTLLAKKFQATKFLCSISTTCIPNFPDRNLPTIFVYLEENIKGQICGPMEFGGMNLTQDGKFTYTCTVTQSKLSTLLSPPQPKLCGLCPSVCLSVCLCLYICLYV